MALDSVTFNTQAALKDSKTDSDTGITVDTYYDATTFEIIGVENKDAGGNTTFKSTKTEDTTGYSAAADVAANAALLLTGDKAAGGKVTNTTAEKVSITSTGDDSGMHFDVTGKNAAGKVVTERVAGANDGTAQTIATFLEVTEVKAVGTPADKVSLAGEGYTEVVEQTETRKETNADGEKVDVTFKVEKTINYDGGAKIKSGTEKIDGKEKTLGENGVVTAETMDTSALGSAITGDTLATAAARYDDVAANATIYAEEENVGGGVKVTTLYATDGTVVGSSDTSVETFGDMTITVTNHLDKDGAYIGTSGTDGTNTWDYTEKKVTTNNVDTRVETGSESYGGETRSFSYVFNESTGDLISGTEVVDGITTTFGANWAITAETIDTSALGDALSGSVLDDLPASVKAASGNTYAKTETFDWGGGETTYFDASGATVGFAYTWKDASGNSNNSYYDANDNYVGDSWSDAEGRSGSSSVVIASDGSKVETGSYADSKNSGDDSSWTYNFNTAGEMTGGEEIRGSVTTTLGANWSVAATKVAVTGLDKLDLDNLDANVKTAFFSGMTTVYTSTETFDWGGSLMTFLNTDGAILGYADSYSDDWDGDGNVDSSGTTYMDQNWNYVGSAWSDSWGDGEQFQTDVDANGDDLASGQNREFGKQTWDNGQGGLDKREFDYTFDSNGNLVSGTETGSDGITTVYGANWAIVSQKGDVSALGDALTTAQLSGVPTSIQSTQSDGNTYAKSSVYDWGTDITYYDSTGAILGYANSSSWDTPEGGKNTNKGYHDADWNWLGGSWADLDASGATIRSGSNSTVDTYTNDANGVPIKTSFVDSGSYREGDEGSTYSWTFNVTYDSNGYENHEMAGGTEVRGTYNDSGTLVGTTYTYGANWALEGAKADTSNLATLDLSTLDAALVTALFGSADAVIKYSTEKFDWNEGFSQSTYYDANGDIVGYGDSWSDDWDGDGTVDSSGQSYMDENWDYVGGSWSDAYGSGHNFTIKTVVNNEITEIREIGENTWKDYDGTSQTNKFDLKYDGNWNLISGTEERGQKGEDGTLSGGEKITYGANWEILSVSRDVNLSSDKIAELTDAQLADIPSALHAASGKTYAETEVNPWGTQVTYLDSDGQILGYSDAWSEEWGSGTSFQDADWNHLGSTYDDQWSTGFHHTVESTLNGEKVYIEKGKRTDKNEDGSLGEVTTNEFIFDENWNMISGTETRGNTTTTFGPNWTIVSQSTDMANVSAVDVSGLPASVKTLLFANESDLTAVKADTETFPWGGSQTTYFDANGKVLGYMDTYSDDWDQDGDVDSSGTSFMDANWNHIGGTYSDEWGSGSNFVVENSDGTRVESGTNTWKNYDGVEETRTFEYTFKADGTLKEGTETSSDGTTLTFGENWEVLGSKVSVDNLTALTNSELADLPAPLKAASGDTFTKVQDWGGGSKQTTYLDSAGNVLGYHDTWSDEYGSGSSYMDAEWNHLGGSNESADGNYSSSSIRVKNDDGTETETGTNKWLEGTTVMNSSYTFEFAANGDMTGGSEVRPDGTTVKLGANWSFLGEEISVDGLSAISQADFDLLPGSITGATAAATLFKDTSQNDMYGGDSNYTSTQKTLLGSDGTVLGYWDSYSDDWNGDNVVDYSGTSFMDANWNYLGGSWQDDFMKSTTINEDIITGTGSNAVKTGIKETRIETEKNDSDGANQYTGQTRETVTEYDTSYNMISITETTTFSDGAKMEFVFNENWEVVSEYSYDKYGVKTITDKYALFQLEKMVFTDDYMKLFAEDRGITNLSDGDGDGRIDAFYDDYDGDGVADLSNDFGQAMLDATVFSMTNDPTILVEGTGIDTVMTGFTLTQNGFKMTMFGDFELDTVKIAAKILAGNFNAQEDALDLVTKGEINSAYVYDVNNSDALVGYSDSLDIDMVDLNSFMSAQPDTQSGPPKFTLGTGATSTEFEAGDNADTGLATALENASWTGTTVTAGDQITEAMIQFLLDANAPPKVYNIGGENGTDYAVDGHPDSGAVHVTDANFVMKLTDFSYTASVAVGANITQAMVDFLVDKDGPDDHGDGGSMQPPVLSLAELMGASSASDLSVFTELAAAAETEMGMGFEQRFDAMGNQIQVTDDGRGNLTEIMTDPLNANIQIKTEFLASGDVRVTQLITDPLTKVVQEVQVGSGSKVEATHFDEVTTNRDGLEVTEREYDMANVYTKVEKGPDGAVTEIAQDARGVEVKFVAATDGSFVEETISADGKTTVKREVNADGVATVTKLITGADGNVTTEAVGTGATNIVNGARVDTTVKADGSKTEVRTDEATGVETWEFYDTSGVVTSQSVRTMQEDGSMQHRNIVGEQEVIVTYTTQEDASLKAVFTTANGTKLKEEITAYDASGNEIVTAQEFLGQNHTRVSVQEGGVQTVVETKADGAVTKVETSGTGSNAKIVKTEIGADKAVVVTEQVGTGAVATVASGTLTVSDSGSETLELTNADGTKEKIMRGSDGSETVLKMDANGAVTAEQQNFEYNDGTIWTEVEESGVNIETYTYANGEIETITTNLTTGAMTVKQQNLNSNGVLQAEITVGTGTSTFNTNTGLLTQTIDLGSGETETRVWNEATGVEQTTFKKDGVVTKVRTEDDDENGNDIVKEELYSSGSVTSTSEKVIGNDGTVQDTVIDAAGAIKVTESGVDGSGKAFSKVLGTGEQKVVDGETVNTIKLSDNSTVIEKFDATTGAQTERVIADQSGDRKISTFDESGSESISYADESGQAVDKSEVDIMVDYGFENTDLGFQNVDFTEMAGGYTSQADNFDMSVGDYNPGGDYQAGGGTPNNTGGDTPNNTGGSNDYADYNDFFNPSGSQDNYYHYDMI